MSSAIILKATSEILKSGDMYYKFLNVNGSITDTVLALHHCYLSVSLYTCSS